MKIDDKLNVIFDLEPVVQVEPVVEQKETTVDDFELARGTLKNMISKNEDVIDNLVNIAKSSEHPRAFEVVGKLIEAQTGLAKELMTLHKTKKDVDGEPVSSIQTQNNIVFAGSTSDLMKMISTQKAKTIESE